MDYLVRYGVIPEVARCSDMATDSKQLTRGTDVIVQTHRGLQMGTVLERCTEQTNHALDQASTFEIVRTATRFDLQKQGALCQECQQAFPRWQQRITEWNIAVELIDLEKTLDGEKTILYVLCNRGPESTKLALQAAVSGLGIVEVQPVTLEGLVPQPAGNGCGACGCQN